MSSQHLMHIALVVRDYDEAIKFYTEKLNFQLVEDSALSETKRWVLVAPPGSNGCCLLLAKAANDEQKSRVGNQTGGRVFLFLHTNNFQEDFSNLKKNGVTIVDDIETVDYGKFVHILDAEGNKVELWEPIG